MTVADQPLLTAFPGGDARLPIEPQVLDQLDILDPKALPNIPVSCLTSPKLGGFSRTAQAASLLDQVFKGFDIPDVDSRLLLLDRLDTNIQAFLSLIIPQCQGQSGAFCAAINIAIRSVLRSFSLLYCPTLSCIFTITSCNLHRTGRSSSYIGTSSACALRSSEPSSNHRRSGISDHKKRSTPRPRWSSTSLKRLSQTRRSLMLCLQCTHILLAPR